MVAVKMLNYIPECGDLFAIAKRILPKICKEGEIKGYPQQSVTYTICYKIGKDKIVCLVSYGKSKPNRCYNRSQAMYDDNILSDDVIHMTNQFIFIIYNNNVLCSDHNRRNIIINLLHEIDDNFSCELLSIATSIDEFMQQVKSIESISITATNDLFINEFLNPTWSEDIDEKEHPETTVIKMDFKRVLKANYVKNIYKKLKQPSYIKSFSIKGKKDDGFISINEDSIIAKNIFEFEKEEGYYDIDEIFKKV